MIKTNIGKAIENKKSGRRLKLDISHHIVSQTNKKTGQKKFACLDINYSSVIWDD
ncbi:hypothetical protein [Siminovitchia fortis]|uniref:hypothetical protein n=1 Tax=Siminovitchia fortis TaxID=254758 RepID=UPI00164305F8|nr:hypothetical protein [Siminovitchia fortis]